MAPKGVALPLMRRRRRWKGEVEGKGDEYFEYLYETLKAMTKEPFVIETLMEILNIYMNHLLLYGIIYNFIMKHIIISLIFYG